MTNLTNQISGFAMLALAALPIAALSTTAYAAPAKVTVSDLNLLSNDGLAAFQQRVDVAARRFCDDVQSLSARNACRKGVRAELNEKMAVVRTAQTVKSASTLAAR